MQKVLATFYLNNNYFIEYKLIQDIKTGSTLVIKGNEFFYSEYNVQEFEKDNNINLNDLLN